MIVQNAWVNTLIWSSDTCVECVNGFDGRNFIFLLLRKHCDRTVIDTPKKVPTYAKIDAVDLVFVIVFVVVVVIVIAVVVIVVVVVVVVVVFVAVTLLLLSLLLLLLLLLLLFLF